MNVLVVGGSGFIGTRLIETLLAAGHDVANYDLEQSAAHPRLTTIGDVRDGAALAAACGERDTVVNLAAAHRDDVRPASLYHSVNVDGARTLAAAAERQGVGRIVFTSSVAVYGLDRPHPSEQSPPDPFNAYGGSKLAAEQVFTGWAAADPRRSLFVVRPSVVFGEANRGNVYTLARQIASGRFLMIGDGANRKSMAYVGNIAPFLASGLDAGPGVHLTNYTDKPDLTTRELVEAIAGTLGLPVRTSRSLPLPIGMAAGHVFDLVARVSGRSFPVSAVRIKKFAADTTIDTTRLERSGFTRPFGITEALRRTLRAEFPEKVAAGR